MTHSEQDVISQPQDPDTFSVKLTNSSMYTEECMNNLRSQEHRHPKKNPDRDSSRKRKLITQTVEPQDPGHFLSSIHSLEGILPKEECQYLAQELWIFTVQQLAHLLNAPENEINAVLIPTYENPRLVIQRWKFVIDTLKNNRLISTTPFLLSGSIACLTSPLLIQFLAKHKIYSVCDLLSTKKTETSDLVMKLTEWRKLQGVESKPLYSYKALMAVDSRLKLALGSVPSLNSISRRWMSGSLLTLPRSVQDDAFLSTKTNILGQKLCLWREGLRLEPLKGTGSVAMISQWKTLLKETTFVNAHPFSSHQHQDRKPGLNKSSEPLIMEKRVLVTPPESVKQSGDLPITSADPAISFSSSRVASSSIHDGTLGCFSGFVLEFLHQTGINTSADLLNYRSSDLANKYIFWRQKENKPELKGNGAYTTVCGWKSSVKEDAKKKQGRVPRCVRVEPTAPEKKSENKMDGTSFWDELNLTSDPNRLNGLPYIELSFHKTHTHGDILYRFLLWSTSSEKGAVVMLAFRGATAYVPKGTTYQEANPVLSDGQSNDSPFIMKEVSFLEADQHFIQKKKMKRVELHQPINHTSGFLDLTRFNLFDQRNDNDQSNNLIIRNYINCDLECNQKITNLSPMSRSRQPTLKTEDPNCHRYNPRVIRLRDCVGSERSILQFRGRIARGQSIQVVLDNNGEHESMENSSMAIPTSMTAILVRIGLYIATLSVKGIIELTLCLEKEFMESVSSLDRLFMTPPLVETELVLIFRLRRRFHVIGSKLLAQYHWLRQQGSGLGCYYTSGPGSADIRRAILILSSMVWDPVVSKYGHILHSLCSGAVLTKLRKDIEDEIRALSFEKGWATISQSRISSVLLQGILDDISLHVATNSTDDTIARKYLDDCIHQRTVSASKLLFDICDKRKSLANNLSFIHNDGKIYPRVIVEKRNKFSERSKAVFSPGDECFCCYETSSMDMVTIHKEWYHVNHILHPVYCVISSGIIPWSLNHHGDNNDGINQVFTLTDFCDLIIWLMGGSRYNRNLYQNVYNIFPGTMPKPSIDFDHDSASMKNSAVSHSNVNSGVTSCIHQRSLRIFLQIVWPSLFRNGWIIDAGCKLDDLRFVFPGRISSVNVTTQKQRHTQVMGFHLDLFPRQLSVILANSLNASSSSSSLSLIPRPCSVKFALDKYTEKKCADLNDEASRTRLHSIMDLFLLFFNEMAQYILLPSERNLMQDASVDKGFHELCSCDILLRVLVLLPEKLKFFHLQPESHRLLVLYISDVLKFLSENLSLFLNMSSQDDSAIVLSEKNINTEDILFLDVLKARSVSVSNMMALLQSQVTLTDLCQGLEPHTKDFEDAIGPTDSGILTDYFAGIMKSVILRFATDDDCIRACPSYNIKAKKGYLVCRYCWMDRNLDPHHVRWYNLGSLNSLQAFPNLHLLHIHKDHNPSIDDRQSFINLKKSHRQQLTERVQSQFFRKLWDRMHRKSVPSPCERNPLLDEEDDTNDTENSFDTSDSLVTTISSEEESSTIQNTTNTSNGGLVPESPTSDEENIPARTCDYQSMTLSRGFLIQWHKASIFEKLIHHLYVTVSIGLDLETQKPLYQYCRIEGVVESENDYYEVWDEKKTIDDSDMTNKYLVVTNGSRTEMKSINDVSDSCALEEDIQAYIQSTIRDDLESKLLTRFDSITLLEAHRHLLQRGSMMTPIESGTTCSIDMPWTNDYCSIVTPPSVPPPPLPDATSRLMPPVDSSSDACIGMVSTEPPANVVSSPTVAVGAKCHDDLLTTTTTTTTTTTATTTTTSEQKLDTTILISKKKKKKKKTTTTMTKKKQDVTMMHDDRLIFSTPDQVMNYLYSSPDWMSKPDIVSSLDEYTTQFFL